MENQEKLLFTPFTLKGKTVKNRLMVPPMVRFWRDRKDGHAEAADAAHYSAFAKGGFGLIVVEATCIRPGGELNACELGAYDDAYIEDLSSIAAAIKAEGAVAILQLHHAGLIAIGEDNVSASDALLESRGLNVKPSRAHGASEEEIEDLIRCFAAAARRAEQAGFDGVELHGCHSYLISQFLSRNLNRREDRYGKPEQFALDVIARVKETVSDAFIVGIRLGAFEPTLKEGLRHAGAMEAAGIDYISVSYGFSILHAPEKPEGYPFIDVIYGAEEIKKAVSVPVFAVRSIVSAEQAEAILEKTRVDGVLIGRGALVNPNWPKDALAGTDTGRCMQCPVCYFRRHRENCPGRDAYEKNRR